MSTRGALRLVAVLAVLHGAAFSLGLLIYAGQRTPRLLLVVMGIWVLSPFVILVLATAASTRWPVPTRRALYTVMLVVALGSVAAYVADAISPPKSQRAFMYVLVPPVSWVFTAIVVGATAFMTRRGSRPS